MSNTEPENKIVSEDSASISQNNLSPEDFDKQLKKETARLFPSTRSSRIPAAAAFQPGNLDGGGAARAAGCLTLDTPTPFVNTSVKGVSRRYKRTFTKSHRRMYNRILLGLQLPGRYYFLTLTSTPTSPPVRKSYLKFSRWLRLYRPGITWLHCITVEGYGVVHMIIRLGHRTKNLDIKEVRAYWQNLTGAHQVNIKRVRESHKKDLADYLANQKLKKSMGREMAYQGSSMVSWHWSEGWLPKGFTKLFARLWLELIDAPDHIRDRVINQALCKAYEAEKKELKKNGK